MPPKRQQESTKLENYMLYIAAKLLEAVRWVAEHRPSPEKVDYLNEKVSEEIAFISSKYAPYMASDSRETNIPRIHPIIQVMTNEWKAASTDQRKPRWDIFTEANIAHICDQVAMHNPTWYRYLYATHLSSYLGGQHPKKMWWLHSIPQPSESQQSAVQGGTAGGSGDADATMQEPDDSSAPAVEVKAPPRSAPSPVGLLTQAAKNSKARIVEEPVKKTQAQPVAAAAPSTAPFTPPMAGPSRKHKAPRRDLSGEVCDSNDDTPTKKATEMPIFEAMQGAGRALDEDSRRQLNRIEAMLNAICNSNGILPETLLGYEHPTSVSPSSQSPSSTGVQMETLHISNICCARKKPEEGEAATPPEVTPVAR
ncbi:hypothetical protein V8E53_009138 [Lactarius tabidus]